MKTGKFPSERPKQLQEARLRSENNGEQLALSAISKRRLVEALGVDVDFCPFNGK